MQKSYFVYILTNKRNTTLYTGTTSGLIKRTYQHKTKVIKGFSQKYNLEKLVYYEVYQDPTSAIEREKQIKAGSRKKKIELINSINPEWRDLYEDLLDGLAINSYGITDPDGIASSPRKAGLLAMTSMNKGIIQIYTGNGKGKTTAALGLMFRALGSGFKVALIQFLKNRQDTGEFKMITEKFPEVEIYQFGTGKFVTKSAISEADKNEAKNGLIKAKNLIESGKFDLIVLDEINVACFFGLLNISEVTKLINSKPENLELILTGRYAPKELIEIAELVTEMKDIKHPYHNGFQARKGIEY